MKKIVILKFDGDWNRRGFRVDLSISKEVEESENHSSLNSLLEIERFLPPNAELASLLHQHWEEKYRQLGAPYRLEAGNIQYDGSVNHLVDECKQSAHQVCLRINHWLKSEQFCDIREQLLRNLSSDETIRFLIRTRDGLLQKLPWQEWDLIKGFPKAEVGLAPYDWGELTQVKNRNRKIRILAILGHSAGINVEADRKLLENLPSAEVTFLVEPNRQNINDQLWEQPWDIIFFAGHGKTEGETGRIYINPDYSLTISELWYALRKAVDRGLQLAIFNSCDGLGLARELDDDLNIPQMIVMRELVPDKVAQEFLKYFLIAFSSGQPFHLAVQDARQRLHGLEDKFPCATWLPVIYQNPTAVPPVWKAPPNDLLRRIATVLLTSLVVTGSVMGAQRMGKLQQWEFPIYDQMMRLRGDEGKDRRLMLVTIDDADIKYQQEQGWNLKFSLSDKGLAALLKKLDKYEPSVIGLYVPRDIGIDSNQKDLKTRFETDRRLYAICLASEPEFQNPGISPPPGVSPKRQGFVNIVRDSDGVVRRHLLSMGAKLDSTCTAPRAFSTMLAFRYLSDRNYNIDFKQGNWIFGDTVLKGLEAGDNGYSKEETKASQILLNYRTNNGSPLKIADTVSLRQILQNKDEQISPSFKNRIIIIGVATSSDKNAGNSYPTPYSTSGENYREIPELLLHAQMTSQLLSIAENNRPLLKVLPQHWEFMWIWGWSLVGGILILRFESKLHLALITLAGGITICILYGMCYGFLLIGYWVTFVPSVVAIVTTSGIAVLYIKFTSSNKKYNFF